MVKLITWVREKSYRFILFKKINKISITLIFFLFFSSNSEANFQENIIKKYEMIDTLYFDFTQKIGNKTENGNCYIKYPLLMKCEYPKKKKSIVQMEKNLQ